MDENIWYEILGTVVATLITVLTPYFIKFINAKAGELKALTNNELLEKYIELAEDIVIKAVETTNQTFVNELKKDGKFTADRYGEAFDKTKETVLALLTEVEKQTIVEVYGDLNTWMQTQIESYIGTKTTTPTM